jgi:hypothetical protein
MGRALASNVDLFYKNVGATVVVVVGLKTGSLGKAIFKPE